MFRKLLDLLDTWRNPKSNATLFGLSEGALKKLHDFRASEVFSIYMNVLDELITLQSESLLAPQASSDSLHFVRGYIAGLRKAGTLVDEILITDERIRNANSARVERSTYDRASAVRSVTYGTPAWRSAERT